MQREGSRSRPHPPMRRRLSLAIMLRPPSKTGTHSRSHNCCADIPKAPFPLRSGIRKVSRSSFADEARGSEEAKLPALGRGRRRGTRRLQVLADNAEVADEALIFGLLGSFVGQAEQVG